MQFKNILVAAQAMANTNGAQVNIDAVSTLVDKSLDVEAIDKWLGTLTRSQLLDVCGVMSEPHVVAAIEGTYPGNIQLMVHFLDELYVAANA